MIQNTYEISRRLMSTWLWLMEGNGRAVCELAVGDCACALDAFYQYRSLTAANFEILANFWQAKLLTCQVSTKLI